MAKLEFGIFFLVQLILIASGSKKRYFQAKLEKKSGNVIVTNGLANGEDNKSSIATAFLLNSVNSTGWAVFEAVTNPAFSDSYQAYALGLLEGHVSKYLINLHWQNVIGDFCKDQQEYCNRLKTFMETNFNFIRQQVEKKRVKDEYWHQVGLVLEQLTGLEDGYKSIIKKPRLDVNIFNLLLINLLGDFEDLNSILNKKNFKKVLGSGSCSALIKPIGNNSDIYVSHVTWNSLESMLRILKSIYLNVHKTADLKSDLIPGYWSTFSSYPGSLHSADDFYLISSGLVTLETTIGNSNQELFKSIKPDTIILEWIRSLVSNRLATNGKEWAKIFSRFNSGTYNNQWMIVDYKKFVPNQTLKDGVLTILEQIPTLIKFSDMTYVLRNQGYWPSYNIPYYKDIFNLSGCPANVEKFGNWFTYEKSPRALIFKRDQSKVVDIPSMIHLMRYNDYKHDPFSECKCDPPYSGENAISARSDLNPANGTYPFEALGQRSHAATDMKLTSYKLFKNKQQFISISGPTYENVPVFIWNKSVFDKKVNHFGHPNFWKFKPIKTNWLLSPLNPIY